MKMVMKALGVSALVAVMLAGSLRGAEAAPIVTLSPSSQTVGLNQAFSVDVLVGGLDGTAAQSIGGFAFTLAFSNALLDGVSYVADPDNKMGTEVDLSFGFTGAGNSPFDAFVAAQFNLNGSQLAALQGTGFRLMRLNFTSNVIEGLSPLTLSQVTLSDALGGELASTFANGSVCVDRDGQNACPTQVPEPGLMALLVAGLGTTAAVRRRKAGTKA